MRVVRGGWMVMMTIGFLFLSACAGFSVDEDQALQKDIAPPMPHRAGLVANGGFENGTLSDWTVNTYLNTGLLNVPPTSFADLGLTANNANSLTSAAGGTNLSQIPAGLSANTTLRYPLYGSYSTVINQTGSGRSTNALTQTFTVSPEDIDPDDHQVHIRFARAPVLQNPGHAASSQPYFFITLNNVSQGNALLFSEFHYANDATGVWKTDPASAQLLYSDWQIADVTAPSNTIALGDKLALTVVAAGCSQGGHFGELYVDGFSTTLPGVAVLTSGPQVANPNTNATYVTSVRNNGNASASNVVVTLPTPAGSTFVSLQIPSGATCTLPTVGTSGSAVCTFSSLAVGARSDFKLVVFYPTTASGDYYLSGQSVVTSAGVPLNGASVHTLVSASAVIADLTTSVTKFSPLSCDHNIGFIATVTNNGPSEATGVQVISTLSQPATQAHWRCNSTSGASCSAGDTISGSGAINFTADFPSNSSFVCQYVATMPTTATGLTTFAIEANTPASISDSYPNNNTASAFASSNGQSGCPQGAQPTGTVCQSSADCSSGHCVDGYCCNSACTAQCMACDNSFAPGTCTPVTHEAPHGNRSSCLGYVCLQGTCAASCTDDAGCAAHFVCRDSICVSSQTCSHDRDCAEGTFCTPIHTCEAPRQQRNSDPNWRVEGAGSAAMGCRQTSGDMGLVSLVGLLMLAFGRRVFRSLSKKAWTLGLLLLMLAAPAARAADNLSFNASHFQLWGGHDDIWATQSAHVPDHLSWGLFATGSGAHDLVRVVSTHAHGAQRALVRYQEALDVGVTLALARWVELSISEAFVWQQPGTAPFLSAQLGTSAHHFSQGDLRFAPKLALFRGERVRLAVTLAATFPTGRQHSFVGEGTVTYTPKALLEIGRVGGLRLLANAGALLRRPRDLSGTNLHHAFFYALGGALPFHIKSQAFEGLLSATGELALHRKITRVDVPLEAHAGLRWWVKPGFGLDVGAGTGLTNGIGSPRWRAFVGLVLQPTRTESPEVPAAPPAPVAPPDRDGDGIEDAVDACPDVPGLPSPDPKLHGCPAPVAKPVPKAPEVGREPLVAIAEVLLFDLGKAHLTDEDLELLDKIDQTLAEHPEARVSVDGHTDSSGPESFNMQLSKKRSLQAYEWLVSHGIDKSRLEPRHFGPRQPRANNASREGRRKNRRVEFHLLTEGHTDVAPKKALLPGRAKP